MGINFPLLAINSYLVNLITSRDYDLSSLTNKNCLDNISNIEINKFNDDMNIYSFFAITSLILEFITVFLNLIMICSKENKDLNEYDDSIKNEKSRKISKENELNDSFSTVF